MNTDSYKEFLAQCKKNLNPSPSEDLSFEEHKQLGENVFRSMDKIKQMAENVKKKFINSMPECLPTFEKKFTENGGEVHWCLAYDDFLEKLFKLLDNKKIKTVNLFASRFMEELGVENELKRKEYSIDRESNSCIIFTPREGIINTGSLFLNFLSSVDMQQVLSSQMKIFVLPINQFLFKPEEIELFSHLYSIYKEGVEYAYLTSLYTPSPLEKNNNVHLFIVDNGRSNILSYKDIRSSLTCINCDACKKVCPVFNLIGEKPYDNVFSGPYANVVLPYLENFINFKHLAFSCTHCGNCTAVCPVKIPVSEMIMANKRYFFEQGAMEVSDKKAMKSVAKQLCSRNKMNAGNWKKTMKIKMLFSNSKLLKEKLIFSASTFNQQYQQQNK